MPFFASVPVSVAMVMFFGGEHSIFSRRKSSVLTVKKGHHDYVQAEPDAANDQDQPGVFHSCNPYVSRPPAPTALGV